MSHFPEGEPDTAEKLDKMFVYAQTKWANMGGYLDAAKTRDAWYKAVNAARRRGETPPPGPPPRYYPAKETGAVSNKPTKLPSPAPNKAKTGPVLAKAGVPTLAAPLVKKMAPTVNKEATPPPAGSSKYSDLAKKAGFKSAAELANKRKLGDSVIKSSNKDFMTKRIRLTESRGLVKSLALIEEMERDALDGPEAAAASVMPPTEPPPGEPPVSDSAVGANTEGNMALQLLTDIKDLLTQLLSAEEGEEAGEGEPELPEEGAAVDALPNVGDDEPAGAPTGGEHFSARD